MSGGVEDYMMDVLVSVHCRVLSIVVQLAWNHMVVAKARSL